ncbi:MULTISPECIES: exodeoxyribonuclease VII small subunit [Paenibacillus]|jgi:exodeoxyribonuclease VII small subunit|uniref:Exodeoxyribonuclease 7 small subunit n=1 Tax=Paenibacillus barengoltzii J12 TaxID=935846 RepID=A0ABY1LU51_9BACL|nr:MULTISPECIES: exodeoxyribonuclease VII small subunit [Paenibacillus]MDU0331637.1 exodeoxyribonuclease VII small subunit [Paenibacillus sp. 3LSP]MEC2342664.1 exodeoxyribonuclease VII small subunit [Paenibacillus barengoltzii]SMF04545.1 Exodeoxyribonuclease VII small subunit [Paenibacillus barengoltzii J12]SMF10320.1 Exodeoxyribonuclease VII small subunit [Paenibacillus barengoltzii]
MKEQEAKLNAADAQQAELNFEDAMNQLEDIVSQLERGDVPLEKAIDLFQQGMRLSQICGQKLAQVERKIEMIVEEDGAVEKQPFQPPLSDSSDF